MQLLLCYWTAVCNYYAFLYKYRHLNRVAWLFLESEKPYFVGCLYVQGRKMMCQIPRDAICHVKIWKSISRKSLLLINSSSSLNNMIAKIILINMHWKRNLVSNEFYNRELFVLKRFEGGIDFPLSEVSLYSTFFGRLTRRATSKL